jgi:hypothetical protein
LRLGQRESQYSTAARATWVLSPNVRKATRRGISIRIRKATRCEISIRVRKATRRGPSAYVRKVILGKQKSASESA